MRLEAGDARFYPDVFVACGDGIVPDPDTKGVAGATVILEVLSPATERYDRGRKWLANRRLPELRHFALVAQDQRRIEAYHREGAGWRYELELDAEECAAAVAVLVGMAASPGTEQSASRSPACRSTRPAAPARPSSSAAGRWRSSGCSGSRRSSAGRSAGSCTAG
ncbi:hypothetical protein DK412_18215 [Methylobacterium sp. 17Sr1-1]|nr:hypothetical protein DK412_18215 [Methylobacterium sp. 17Sr1-1]